MAFWRGWFSSVRARLLLWNTLTFAVVLVLLGVAFRFLAENYLLNALDREIRMQAQRFQESHEMKMVVLSGAPPMGDVTFKMFPSLPGAIKIATKTDSIHRNLRVNTEYRVMTKNMVHTIRTNIVDKSGQFLFRSFDLEGRPLSHTLPRLPFDLPSANDEMPEEKKRLPDYRPWDKRGFARASKGKERIANIAANGTTLRVLSLPLREDKKIIGVVQIAASLGQLNRDIAGLTHALILILPLALLVAVGTGVFLTERAMRPVQSLTQAAMRIRPDQLSQRLPISGSDEFDRLASTFNRALDRVELAFEERERAMEQLRRFTADASHELRTPLTTIKANTGVALAETEPSQEHIHSLRQIDRAADRMTALVRDLLLLARSDSGQVTLDFRSVSLEEVVRESMDLLSSRPHAPILLDAPQTALIVCGDGDHLCRLFVNLLENAARYTPPEGQITVGLERRGQEAVITVQDTGCGVTPEHLPHLGERFYRADSGRNRKQGGAGLGLAICRSIVAQHHGTLSITSEVGKGTTVTVCLPLA